MKRKTKKSTQKKELSPKARRVITLAKVLREKEGKKPGPEVYKMNWNQAEKEAAKKIRNNY